MTEKYLGNKMLEWLNRNISVQKGLMIPDYDGAYSTNH